MFNYPVETTKELELQITKLNGKPAWSAGSLLVPVQKSAEAFFRFIQRLFLLGLSFSLFRKEIGEDKGLFPRLEKADIISNNLLKYDIVKAHTNVT